MQPLLGSNTAAYLKYLTKLKVQEYLSWQTYFSWNLSMNLILALHMRASGKPKRSASHLTTKIPWRICSEACACCRVTGTILRGLPAKNLFMICLSLYIWPHLRWYYWLQLGYECLEWEAIYLHYPQWDQCLCTQSTKCLGEPQMGTARHLRFG